MIAIETRYLGPTNYKPSRIVVETANGQRMVVSRDAASDATDNSGQPMDECRYAAQLLADKMGWGQLGHGGGTKRGYVFCFPPKA